MRTDCKRDNRQTKLPHLVPTLGSDLWIAKRGNWVQYGNGYQVGRVVGGVTALSGEDKGKRYIEIIALSSGCDFPMVRWIVPKGIVRVSAEPPRETFDLICRDDFYSDIIANS